ncbi:MAG: TIM barrel protein [Candidatus Nanoarchaeia archaeon]
MQFSSRGYYGAMDDFSGGNTVSPLATLPVDEEGQPVVPDDSLNFTAKDIGTTTNPMGNTLESLKARIREGTSRIEFSFMGQHKGNSQNPTPESFGNRERQDMRELVKINEMKTSTHAAVHANALSGMTQNGFNDAARGDIIHEIKRAIQFAGEATKGGAIVFHIHEWNRPLSDIKDKSGAKFQMYDEENRDAEYFAVDKRTGEFVSKISKDREIFRPDYITAKDKGLTKDAEGKPLQPDDWIDLRGVKIPKDADPERLFDRVPKFNEDKTNFAVKRVTWDDLVKETDEWNKNNPNKPQRSYEEMFAIVDMENRVLQFKGQSLYHARGYQEEKRRRDDLLNEYNAYKILKESLPESEQWQLKAWNSKFAGRYFEKHDEESMEQFYERAIKFQENSMRHTHESSASADAQAEQTKAVIENIESAEKYGLKKAADTIAQSAIYAMKTYEQNKEKFGLEEPLYVAPENWSVRNYGSHPDEYRKVIDESRARMVNLLMTTQGKSKKEAEELAKKHIKGTLDIGHLNTYRQYYRDENGEIDEKKFEKWMLDQAEDLVKKGYVGHIHMSDNYGFDDEHITPGQGNVPVKEFLKRMEKLGMKDMIVESGSFNVNTAMLDTLSLINSPIYGTGSQMRFRQAREQHFGYNSPGFFIAGSYAPSNDWKPWTDIPLE